MPEYKVQEVKKSKYVIAHYGIFKIGWDWLILLCTFYTAIMVPYNAAFTDMENDNSKSSLYSDIVVEIMFIIGMWICERMCIHVPPKFVVLFYQTILIKDYSNNSIFHTSSENVIKIALKLQQFHNFIGSIYEFAENQIFSPWKETSLLFRYCIKLPNVFHR